VKAAGYVVYYYPGVSITHHGGGSISDPSAGLGHFITSSIRLYQKYRLLRERKKLHRALNIALRLRLFLKFLFSPSGFSAEKKALVPLLDILANAPERE